MNDLKARGIGTSVHYPVPLPLSGYYKAKYGADDAAFRNARRLSDRSIALPVGPHLTPDDMQTLASELKTIIRKWK
jgi:dTDP-4-amino-4,6-dideoxygalactose transaminase